MMSSEGESSIEQREKCFEACRKRWNALWQPNPKHIITLKKVLPLILSRLNVPSAKASSSKISESAVKQN